MESDLEFTVMKKIIILILTLSSLTAFGQSEALNDLVRLNPPSSAKTANALDASASYGTSGTNTYAISPALGQYAGGLTYASGDMFTITIGIANSSSTVSLNVDAEGAVALKNNDGTDPEIGSLCAGCTFKFRHNATNFRMVGSSGGGIDGHIIENSGTPLTQRANLNFTSGLTANDNSPNTDASVDLTYGFNWSGTHTFSQKLITLNKGGAAASGNGVGFEIEENGGITGYFKTNSARTGFEFRSPASINGSSAGTLIFPDDNNNNAYTFIGSSSEVLTTNSSHSGGIGGIKTFTTQTLRVFNPALTFSYRFVSSAIVANRNMTIPLLTGNDIFVFQDFSQTLANKAISGANNTITNVSLTTGVTGILPVANGGTNFSSYTIGDLIQASASGVLSKLNSVATGNVLITGGVATVSSWGKVTSSHIDATVQTSGLSWLLTGTSTLTGAVTIAHGGNNVSFSGTGKVTFSPTNGGGSIAGFNPGSVTNNPATLANGDLFYRTVDHNLVTYKNSSVQAIVTTPSATTGRVLYWGNGAEAGAVDNGSFAFTTTGGLALTPATTIQISFFRFNETSTLLNHAIGTDGLIDVLSTGANSTASKIVIGVSSIVQKTGTTNINIGNYSEATGASTDNIAYLGVGKIQTKGSTTTATYSIALSKWPENTTQSIALVGNNLFIDGSGNILRENTSVSRGQAWVYYTGYSGVTGNALGYSTFNTGSSTLTHPKTIFQTGDTQLIAGGRFGWVTSTTDSRGSIASNIGHSSGSILVTPTAGILLARSGTITASTLVDIRGAGTTSSTINTRWANSSNGVLANITDDGNWLFNGKHVFDVTITTPGTTGNQTINKPGGTVNIAAAGTTVTVTNSFCTTSSNVTAIIRTNDGTAFIKNVVPGAGSFVINLGAAATAEIAIFWKVEN